MLNAFNSHIKERFPFLKISKIVIAISGGVDSVVLAHLCKELELNFSLAHCNFNLRGEESNLDEEFVLELAEQLNVEVFIQNFDTEAYAKLNKLSIQMAARELRYNWFEDLAKQLQFDYILTAHHADDNLETFLINFTRGTGINGLTGIPEINDNVARPLLRFSRNDIEAYANENDITWREDSSNSSRKYLRNKLRHEIVPILKEINPQLLDSVQSTLSNLQDTAAIVNTSVKDFLKNAIVKEDEASVMYAVSEFKTQANPKAFLFEVFKDYGFTAWNDVANLLDAETGKYVKSNTHCLTKHREFLILSECHSELVSESNIILSEIEVEDGNVETPLGVLLFDEVDALNDNSDTTIYVDAKKLECPLELRLCQAGDVFYPLGMKGKKKVSKYLKDEKLTPVEKENSWVLTSNNKVVWVVGRRADDRFKVTDQTNKILKIELG
ncbi:tRNA lysidine(34) synthetase TilS [Winogradskyella sp.]|jgi:tRNA(Ile)-lysidine synthase|uniref:tRNA lysidine(34) synthetase TilS n=1 Tax=Winogradskyella sp. TaxID=1883156 RepID=UPI0025FFDD2A|nr:tRNA lysidine(34) synthetase TilS [Winogradskyella sp.]MCT4628533.1 tRNA lysidine(34) synthetase TilS [Winogradskyella sp.]